MVCPICVSYMLCHPSLIKHKKCPTCGFTCPDPIKEQTVMDREVKMKPASPEMRKALGLKDDE